MPRTIQLRDYQIAIARTLKVLSVLAYTNKVNAEIRKVPNFNDFRILTVAQSYKDGGTPTASALAASRSVYDTIFDTKEAEMYVTAALELGTATKMLDLDEIVSAYDLAHP